MNKWRVCALALSVLAAVSLGLAQTSKRKPAADQAAKAHDAHVMVTPEQVRWGPAPPSLPPGAELAVLDGDPSKAGVPFTIRGRFPDGYKVPPHWHPTDEHVVVLEGALLMGLGEKLDEAVAHELVAGSYARMPKGVRHFAVAKGPTVIQVSGIGPFAINYVNPADDPRNNAHK
ncbi:MAG TPA: cupin domain-containing protein [Pyrinomonadaceae bacterium]|jgi:quercetin dioxygenase-like cupin family protein